MSDVQEMTQNELEDEIESIQQMTQTEIEIISLSCLHILMSIACIAEVSIHSNAAMTIRANILPCDDPRLNLVKAYSLEEVNQSLITKGIDFYFKCLPLEDISKDLKKRNMKGLMHYLDFFAQQIMGFDMPSHNEPIYKKLKYNEDLFIFVVAERKTQSTRTKKVSNA